MNPSSDSSGPLALSWTPAPDAFRTLGVGRGAPFSTVDLIPAGTRQAMESLMGQAERMREAARALVPDLSHLQAAGALIADPAQLDAMQRWAEHLRLESHRKVRQLQRNRAELAHGQESLAVGAVILVDRAGGIGSATAAVMVDALNGDPEALDALEPTGLVPAVRAWLRALRAHLTAVRRMAVDVQNVLHLIAAELQRRGLDAVNERPPCVPLPVIALPGSLDRTAPPVSVADVTHSGYVAAVAA